MSLVGHNSARTLVGATGINQAVTKQRKRSQGEQATVRLEKSPVNWMTSETMKERAWVVRQEVEMQNQVQAVRQSGMRGWSIARLVL